jgi:peroxiredoxin
MRIVPALVVAVVAAQTPVDVSKIGPQVGATVADFTLKDHRGQDHSLSKAAGTKGTMLVFFRSADW